MQQQQAGAAAALHELVDTQTAAIRLVLKFERRARRQFAHALAARDAARRVQAAHVGEPPQLLGRRLCEQAGVSTRSAFGVRRTG
jgi:hypothetical protein